MKFINKFKSPNFNKRKGSKVKFIIIHYTALKNCSEAISYLCKKSNKVSSHFLISQKGEVYNLVNEKNRAWHAGLSYWSGFTDLNSFSIGIELDYSSNKLNNKYSKILLNSLIYLLNYLKKKYKISSEHILAHSDIAPFRKKDPGKYFPWKYLESKKLVFLPKNKKKHDLLHLETWFKKNRIKSKRKIAIYILNRIGYDTKTTSINAYLFKKLIKAYQMHYFQKKVTGNLDLLTYNQLLKHYLNLVLTKT